MFFFFFFQAEDGIRDWSVTGVQTCALPICSVGSARESSAQRLPCPIRSVRGSAPRCPTSPRCGSTRTRSRSEERRVGKECRDRGAPEQQKERRKDTVGSGSGAISIGD